MKKKYSEEQLIDAVKNSYSIAQTLRTLNMNSQGGSYVPIKKEIQRLNLDISHFTGQGHNAGKTIGPKRPIKDYFSNKFPIKSNELKLRILREGIKPFKCECCSLAEWNGEKIPLELHHKDENHYNNNLENLEILCPNCHALSHKTDKKIRAKKEIYFCSCGREKYKNSKLCKLCNDTLPKLSQRRIQRPTKEELEILIKENSFSALGRKFGVSDNAIRKWCKTYRIY